MRAKQLVPILAEKFGVSFETAQVIDRALADHGLRAKGKGRAWPEMTRREALHFLIGCMATTTVKQGVTTRAATEVSRWILSTSAIIEVVFDDSDQLAALMVDTSAEGFKPSVVLDRSERFPFLKSIEGQWVSLIDYLLHIMSDDMLMEDARNFTISISPSHLEASVCFWSGLEEDRRIEDKQLFYAEGAEELDLPPPIRTDVTVGGEVLWEIAGRTDDPFEKAAG